MADTRSVACQGDFLSSKNHKTLQQNKAYQKSRSPLPTVHMQRADFRIIVYFPDENRDDNFNPQERSKGDAVPDGVFCTMLSFLSLICEINLNFVLFTYIWIILLHFLFSSLPFPPSTTDDFEDSMNETKCWHGLAGFPDKINIKLNVRHMP